MTKKSRDRRVNTRKELRTTKALSELGTTLENIVYKGPDVDKLLEKLNK